MKLKYVITDEHNRPIGWGGSDNLDQLSVDGRRVVENGELTFGLNREEDKQALDMLMSQDNNVVRLLND